MLGSSCSDYRLSDTLQKAKPLYIDGFLFVYLRGSEKLFSVDFAGFLRFLKDFASFKHFWSINLSICRLEKIAGKLQFFSTWAW